MNRNSKKTRPTVETVKRAEEPGTNNHESPESCSNCTTSGSGGQMVHIADLLSRGAENGITIHHLEKMTDLNPRDIRKRIEVERRTGTPILSDNQHGYFLPDSPAEVEAFVQSMNRRADEIRAVAAAVKGAAV